jgi:hypothetical protein
MTKTTPLSSPVRRSPHRLLLLTAVLLGLVLAPSRGHAGDELAAILSEVADLVEVADTDTIAARLPGLQGKIASWVDQLRAAAKLPAAGLPADLVGKSPTFAGSSRGRLPSGSLVIASDVDASHVRRVVMLVHGSVSVSHLNDSVVIATGGVDISHGKNNVVLAGHFIGVSHDGETPRSGSAPGAPRGGGVLVSGGEIRISHSHGSLLSTPGPIDISHANGTHFLNCPNISTSHRHGGAEHRKPGLVFPAAPVVHLFTGGAQVMDTFELENKKTSGVLLRSPGGTDYACLRRRPLRICSSDPISAFSDWSLSMVHDEGYVLFQKGREFAHTRVIR